MHPEVESSIRAGARKYLAALMDPIHPVGKLYVGAAEVGVVTFDDLYFLGLVDECNIRARRDLVEMGQAPIVTERETGIPFFDVKDPDFEAKETEREYTLVADLYRITPDQAEERWYDIMRRITRFRNESLPKPPEEPR